MTEEVSREHPLRSVGTAAPTVHVRALFFIGNEPLREPGSKPHQPQNQPVGTTEELAGTNDKSIRITEQMTRNHEPNRSPWTTEKTTRNHRENHQEPQTKPPGNKEQTARNQGGSHHRAELNQALLTQVIPSGGQTKVLSKGGEALIYQMRGP